MPLAVELEERSRVPTASWKISRAVTIAATGI
jgi:hypothetical protein